MTARKRVAVTDANFPDLSAEQAAAESGGAEFRVFQCKTPAETKAALAGVDAALVQFAPVDAAAVAAMNPGGTIVRYGVGWDNVDAKAARARGVQVAYVPDYCLGEVADHAAALALALSRKLFALDSAVRRGEWSPAKTAAPLKPPDMSAAGLVGVGRIGRLVLERLRPFGFRLLAADPALSAADAAELGAEKCGYPEILSLADLVVFNAPSTPQTRGMLDAKALAKARDGIMIVNCARGDLINESDLAAALESGKAGAAGLDVFAEEPLPDDSPLRRAPNVILTPHAAWFSDRAVANLQRLAADEVSRALRGEPPRKPVPM